MFDDDLICFGYADAFLDDQRTLLGDWRQHQWIALALTDDDRDYNAECALTPAEARALAFRLLVLAEHAERRADGREDAT
jgi:hypothetical protein